MGHLEHFISTVVSIIVPHEKLECVLNSLTIMSLWSQPALDTDRASYDSPLTLTPALGTAASTSFHENVHFPCLEPMPFLPHAQDCSTQECLPLTWQEELGLYHWWWTMGSTEPWRGCHFCCWICTYRWIHEVNQVSTAGSLELTLLRYQS